eukprot:EG_transcript_16321
MPPLTECLWGVAFVAFAFTIATVACPVLLLSYCLLPRARHNAFAIQVQESGLTAMMWFLQGRFDFVLTGDELPDRESALVLCNHQSNDWAAIYCLAIRRLNIGAVRCFLKNSLKYIPGFGWGMYLMSWPCLSRDWEKDGPYIKQLFEMYRQDSMPLVLWLFPEGTRLTKQKLEASQAHSREKGYPVLSNVLLPRHRAFAASIHGVDGLVEYCYDCTVAYSGWGGRNPKSFDFIFRKADHVAPKVHLHVKRVAIRHIPQGEEGLKEWLLKSFEEKDALLATFRQTQRFPGDQRVETVPDAQFLVPLAVWGTLTVFWWLALLGAAVAALQWLLA